MLIHLYKSACQDSIYDITECNDMVEVKYTRTGFVFDVLYDDEAHRDKLCSICLSIHLLRTKAK